MTIDHNPVDFVSAPKDNDELFRRYFEYVVALVKKNGIEESNKEDVASEILTRLIERDFLSIFDPTLTFLHDGKEHHARFKTFLSFAVNNYCRGHRDRQKRRADREVLILDKPTSYQEVDSTWAEWWGVDAQPSHEDGVIEFLDACNLLAGVREHLATIPRRNAFDKCDLVELFDAIMEQLARTGTVSNRELQEKFAMSTSGINSWMWWFKGNVCEYLDIPLPTKRARKVL